MNVPFEGDVPIWSSDGSTWHDTGPKWPQKIVLGAFGRHDHGPGWGQWVCASGAFDFSSGWTQNGCVLRCALPRRIVREPGAQIAVEVDFQCADGLCEVYCDGRLLHMNKCSEPEVSHVEVRLPAASSLTMVTVDGADRGGLPNIVILMTGQSNSIGAGGVYEPWNTADQPIPGVVGWNCIEGAWQPARLDDWSLGLKPPGSQSSAFHFARYLSRRYPRAVIGLIVIGEGGQSIARWSRSCGPGDIYDATVQHVSKALENSWCGSIDGILWSQGQGDAGMDAGTYRTCLREVIDQYRAEPFCYVKTPFISCELPGKRVGSGVTDRQTEALRDLDRDADDKTATVRSASLPTSDLWHFNTASHRELGRRFLMAWAWMLRGARGPRLSW